MFPPNRRLSGTYRPQKNETLANGNVMYSTLWMCFAYLKVPGSRISCDARHRALTLTERENVSRLLVVEDLVSRLHPGRARGAQLPHGGRGRALPPLTPSPSPALAPGPGRYHNTRPVLSIPVSAKENLEASGHRASRRGPAARQAMEQRVAM